MATSRSAARETGLGGRLAARAARVGASAAPEWRRIDAGLAAVGAGSPLLLLLLEDVEEKQPSDVEELSVLSHPLELELLVLPLSVEPELEELVLPLSVEPELEELVLPLSVEPELEELVLPLSVEPELPELDELPEVDEPELPLSVEPELPELDELPEVDEPPELDELPAAPEPPELPDDAPLELDELPEPEALDDVLVLDPVVLPLQLSPSALPVDVLVPAVEPPQPSSAITSSSPVSS
jgi:hypothetical protein